MDDENVYDVEMFIYPPGNEHFCWAYRVDTAVSADEAVELALAKATHEYPGCRIVSGPAMTPARWREIDAKLKGE